MGKDEPSLKERAEEKLKKNPSALGDPVSLKAETSKLVPTEEDEGADVVKKNKKADQGKENPTMLGDHTSIEKEKIEPGKKRNSKL